MKQSRSQGPVAHMHTSQQDSKGNQRNSQKRTAHTLQASESNSRAVS